MKAYSTVCIDCGSDKQPATLTGSWQCETCQNKLFIKIRNKRDGIVLPSLQEQIMTLTEHGLSAKDIAIKLNISTNSVYKHRYNAKKSNRFIKHTKLTMQKEGSAHAK